MAGSSTGDGGNKNTPPDVQVGNGEWTKKITVDVDGAAISIQITVTGKDGCKIQIHDNHH